MTSKKGEDQETNRRESAPTASLSCDVGVFSPEEEKRHETLLKKTLGWVRDFRETDNGYTGSISVDNFLTIAEWISLERRCCPLHSFQIEMPSGNDLFQLTVTGPKGVKDIHKTLLASM